MSEWIVGGEYGNLLPIRENLNYLKDSIDYLSATMEKTFIIWWNILKIII
jgi:hypothetical protein